VFEATVLPRDYDTIEIPFPERGEPELVRWDARAAALLEERTAAETAG
jgi:ribonuclease Z